MNDEPLDETQERLLRRMRAADPAQQITPAASSWIPDLVEATMSTDFEPVARRPRRWAPALAAAAVVAVVAGGAYAVLQDDDSGPATTTAPTTTSLALPGGGDGASMSSCIQFDVAFLRDMQVAFSGTATEVGGDTVTLEVDRWYKGGDADVVRLANFDPANTSLDGFTFEHGDRYLISATDGTVSFCGFSGPWSEELAGAFDEAFAS